MVVFLKYDFTIFSNTGFQNLGSKDGISNMSHILFIERRGANVQIHKFKKDNRLILY
jgi:hypothetical protein